MDKKGTTIPWIFSAYLIIVVIIYLTLAYRIYVHSDDSLYKIKIHSREVGLILSQMNRMDGNTELKYSFDKKFGLNIKDDEAIVSYGNIVEKFPYFQINKKISIDRIDDKTILLRTS